MTISFPKHMQRRNNNDVSSTDLKINDKIC
jgi:hypothetical protein